VEGVVASSCGAGRGLTICINELFESELIPVFELAHVQLYRSVCDETSSELQGSMFAVRRWI
jgi:hypothetical protein